MKSFTESRWPGASPIQRRTARLPGGGCCKAAPAVPFRPAHEPPPHDLEAVEGIGLNAGKPGPRRGKVLRLDGQGHMLGFHIAVVAPLVLHPQDVHRLVPDGVQVVALPGDTEHFIGGAASAAAVQSDPDADGGVIAVIEIAKAFKDAPLILRPCQVVIHILEGNGLGEGPALQPAQAVGKHVLKQDAVLHRMGFSVALCLPDHRLDLLALGYG